MKALFIAFAFCFAEAALAEQQLFCRGTLPYAVLAAGDDAVIFIQRNTTAAGERGIQLAPGACAFATQPMAKDDPTRIFMDQQSSNGVRPWIIAFAPCATNPRCVFEFLVEKKPDLTNFVVTGFHFRAEKDFARVHFPTFP